MIDPRVTAANQAQSITAIVSSAIGGLLAAGYQAQNGDSEKIFAAARAPVSLEPPRADIAAAIAAVDRLGLVGYVLTSENELMSSTLPYNAVFLIPKDWLSWVLSEVAANVRAAREWLSSQGAELMESTRADTDQAS